MFFLNSIFKLKLTRNFRLKNILLIQPKKLLKNIYPKAIWNLSRKEKVIYLTFDDGPIEGLTDWVLDELKMYEASATFFCVGNNIIKNREIFERIKRENHSVGNHTMFHTKGFSADTNSYLSEIEDCKKLVDSNLFRPPYGRMKFSQYKKLIKLGYKIILWDNISYDYEKITAEHCLKNVIRNTKNGSIVLFHDNIKAEVNLKYTLPLFLEHFKNLGFQFKSI